MCQRHFGVAVNIKEKSATLLGRTLWGVVSAHAERGHLYYIGADYNVA